MQNLWYMDKFSHKKHALLLSLPPRGAWIEIHKHLATQNAHEKSLPPRGAWIEIKQEVVARGKNNVAPPAGSVD